jgi:hypothetical protein
MYQRVPDSAEWILKQDANGATIGDKWCTQNNSGWTTSMTDMIEVEASASYAPIVPLVPIPKLQVTGSGITATGGVRSKAQRTLVQDVSLEGVIIPTATVQTFQLNVTHAAGGTTTPSGIHSHPSR